MSHLSPSVDAVPSTQNALPAGLCSLKLLLQDLAGAQGPTSLVQTLALTLKGEGKVLALSVPPSSSVEQDSSCLERQRR